ncbi:MAG: hypothetical protein IKS98_13145 [Lachnospiraceae bacterium]|nr:hypothetical protein [Lachnospiraceae bacterium]
MKWYLDITEHWESYDYDYEGQGYEEQCRSAYKGVFESLDDVKQYIEENYNDFDGKFEIRCGEFVGIVYHDNSWYKIIISVC